MVALKILDVKSFMSSLLIHPVFDNFLVSEVEINTFNTFKIAGRLNQSWFSSEETLKLQDREYSTWSDLKPIAYTLIKGNKTPLSFKIVCLLSAENSDKIISKTKSKFEKEEVDGFFLNIRFEKEELSLITGISMKTFSLDKSLEHEWDNDMKTFLKHYGIIFEEL